VKQWRLHQLTLLKGELRRPKKILLTHFLSSVAVACAPMQVSMGSTVAIKYQHLHRGQIVCTDVGQRSLYKFICGDLCAVFVLAN
jgi:hypothetical protein